MQPNKAILVDFVRLVIVFWPKITLLNVLCWKMHCHDAKYICLVKYLVLFKECVA
jgi:hypothetical protein